MHERRFPFRHGNGEITIRWRNTSSGPVASLDFNDQPLTIKSRRTDTRNGRTTTQETPADWPPQREFAARGLIDDIDTVSLEPERKANVTGLAALGANLDPRSWQTHRFVMTAGHSASGVVYNSSVTSKRAIRIEIDTDAMTALYIETSNFDDG